MFHSVFQIFKIGIGPSSSHTMGPMTACARFRFKIADHSGDPEIVRVRCVLFGSLAFTGKGHATDRAVALGLVGFLPDNVDSEAASAAVAQLESDNSIVVASLPPINFDPGRDIVFDYDATDLPHANTMLLEALGSHDEVITSETYCSVGGGFVSTKSELLEAKRHIETSETVSVPHPYASMADLLAICRNEGAGIAEISRRNEASLSTEGDIDAGLDALLLAMDRSIDRGLKATGELPGGLNVKRRAKKIFETLSEPTGENALAPHAANDWLCAYAMAVNEENAAGNQIVTAPTNGAAGVVPAVLRYYRDHIVLPDGAPDKYREFLLVASAVGSIIKQRASISGAEMGCQGEVGSASAMAAAGLCSVMGGSNEQIENAAEIALEHHLGLTCDPVRGLVQVPCIERNGFGAIKAVTAASLALHGDGGHIMPLDNCIDAMRETGLEMSTKFKETSRGGLAVNLPGC